MRFGYTDLSRDKGTLEFGWKHMLKVLWREIFTLVKANLCFILFCLPVITIPAALTALHRICIDAIRGKSVKVAETYFDTLRTLLLPSIGAFTVIFLLVGSGIYGAVFYYQWPLHLKLLRVLLLLLPSAIGVTALLMCPYCFSLLACTPLPLKKVLKNAFLLVFLNLKFSICCGVLLMALLICQLHFWLQALPLILTCGFAVMVYTAAYFALFGIQEFVLTESL